MTAGPSLARPDGAALPLSLRLREGTREAHERIERAASFNRLIVVRVPESDDAGAPLDRVRREEALAEYREVYRRFLIAAHGFEAAAERRISDSPARAALLASGYPPEPFDPAELIRDDLARVFGAAAPIGLPPMDELPPARSLAALAGQEYVRRGSRAGGTVIAAVVQHNLGHADGAGLSFLGRYGKRTRAVLAELRAWLDALPLSEAEAREAVAAAGAVFAAIERWHLALDASFAAR